VVSHDLKAPLRGISNLVSWIEEDHPEQISPEVSQNLQLIKGRVFRLENMINGLLEYARIGKIKKEEEQIDVNVLIEEIREMIVPPNVKFMVADLPLVYAQRHQLEHIFSNLISNAIKHNKSAVPMVAINGVETDRDYEFSVSDNGQGIEKEYFGKIFIIFQTLRERDAFESTGVGLAIVKKIIDDNKGTIRVESVLGKGTTFIFTLPKPKI
jgi:light-regulated signal transduction histidine kinase (bacteriophytochrome)